MSDFPPNAGVKALNFHNETEQKKTRWQTSGINERRHIHISNAVESKLIVLKIRRTKQRSKLEWTYYLSDAATLGAAYDRH